MARYIIGGVELVAAVLAIAFAYNQWKPESGLAGKASLVLLGVLGISLVGQWMKYSRRARYGSEEVLDAYVKTLARTHLLAERSDHVSTNEIKLQVMAICSDLARVLSEVSGQKCSVCVKLISKSGNPTSGRSRQTEEDFRLQVETLARDSASGDAREQRVQKTKHWIDSNSDFSELFSEESRNYHQNWLPFIADYSNTSLDAYSTPGWKFARRMHIPVLHDIACFLTWPLPYKSTIVSAIRSNAVEETSDDSATIIGYLCVDSISPKAFKAYDTFFIQGVSQGLYPIVSVYREMRRRASRRR